MKKVIALFLTFTIMFLITNPNVKAAQTLGQMETELNQKQAALDANNASKAQNKQDISNTKTKINTIYSKMATIQNTIDTKTKESEELEKSISKKNEETKNLMRYYQVSSSGSTMLEYIMGAESLTDLIYRLSITEQITTYNEKTIKEMNQMIKENEQIKKDLAAQKQEMANLQKQLSVNLAKLTEDQQNLDEEGVTIAESIKDMKSMISYLKSKGCKSSETQNSCLSRIYASSGSGGSGSAAYLPSGSTFYRPTAYGKISSEFGYRPSLGDYHYGTDISVPIGTPVYAVANGLVAKTKSGDSCGTQIMLWHNINGRSYTSWYCHLSAIKISVGQAVTKDTMIGLSGNTGNSTGPHLHLSMATGLWYNDYYNYSGSGGYTSRAFNSRNVILFPSYGVSWSNR